MKLTYDKFPKEKNHRFGSKHPDWAHSSLVANGEDILLFNPLGSIKKIYNRNNLMVELCEMLA